VGMELVIIGIDVLIMILISVRFVTEIQKQRQEITLTVKRMKRKVNRRVI
jgi:hypothetical protein